MMMTRTIALSFIATLAMAQPTFAAAPAVSAASAATHIAQGLRLIETAPGKQAWMSEKEIGELSNFAHDQGHCGGFMDVTEHLNRQTLAVPFSLFDGREATQQKIVTPLLREVSAAKLLEKVRVLSAYKNRYYKSATGVQAAEWIRDQFKAIGKNRSDISVELFKHSFIQPSVIARIAGRGPHKDEIVIIGAHEDSINWKGFFPGANDIAPGADDDASGVATVLESFRILVEAGYQPDRTLEFMTYAGEEKGLLGSQDIARSYQKAQKKVVGVLQMDMTFYPGSTPAITLINDNTNAGLTDFTVKLIDTYVKFAHVLAPCGYACSDHASWNDAGYPSVFPFEAKMDDDNPAIHSPQDTLDKVDIVFGTHFVKLVTAFAVETTSAK
ncbi:MAG: M20/M25/M40 family metallo-hydrolase [Methylotenera sp.]|nr:M20/M25/M40 family metallo-hydrolase [Oligoflexia bacterium]